MVQQPLPLSQQIAANFGKVEAFPAFNGGELWLTFCLWGVPENLQSLATALEADGWTNTRGAEGGFLYPKVRARKALAEIVRRAELTKHLCEEYGVGIILIDADTSPNVGGEHRPFVTLYRSLR